jgi:isoamylase
MKRWRSTEGAPYPLGASWVEAEEAFNFALYTKSAKEVRLLCYSADDWVKPVFTYDFQAPQNKTGPIWHARISRDEIPTAAFYAYSVDGSVPAGGNGSINAFKPNKVLLDPYARDVFFPPTFDRSAAYGDGNNEGKALLGVLPSLEPAFDWGDDQPPRHDSDLIIYELHVRGFTENPNSGLGAKQRGTFEGIIEKIPYLKELGITAVELMPVYGFDETEPNYWGYMPLTFFAPHHLFSMGEGRVPGEAILEFKRMVKALHEADIEVILDVVYNHTGEGNELGPTFNFKGIDCWTYYIPSFDPGAPYADFSGTGNTLNCAHRAVRKLIVDSLRYWAVEMHVDGFRFDLASVFTRNRDGSINLEDPPIFGDINEDPHLEKVRLIAEPWEGNAKYPNYALGGAHWKRYFPGNAWRQWNDMFRTAVRRFIKSDPGVVGDFMTRLYGSSDVFPDSLVEACRPYQSLNYIASHDGLTLWDMVTYNSPDSWNCGEPEQDGEDGVEPEVTQLRKRQVKNFCCALMLSNGTPMFRAGDEFLQTQGGNHNPYNLDSPVSWLDWQRLTTHCDMFRFFSKMIAFRKRHLSIARSTFWRDDIKWYGLDSEEVDLSEESRALAFCLHGASQGDNDIYALINAHWEPLTFEIQEPGPWKRIVDTFQESPCDICEEHEAPAIPGSSYEVQPRSIVVLLRPAS